MGMAVPEAGQQATTSEVDDVCTGADQREGVFVEGGDPAVADRQRSHAMFCGRLGADGPTPKDDVDRVTLALVRAHLFRSEGRRETLAVRDASHDVAITLGTVDREATAPRPLEPVSHLDGSAACKHATAIVAAVVLRSGHDRAPFVDPPVSNATLAVRTGGFKGGWKNVR
jgi:hypothetical protein